MLAMFWLEKWRENKVRVSRVSWEKEVMDCSFFKVILVVRS